MAKEVLKKTPVEEVDIFEENTIHGGLNGRAHLLGVYRKLMLCAGSQRQEECQQKRSNDCLFSHTIWF